MEDITLDFSAIVAEVKKDFTRERGSKIKNYLLTHPNTIITSEVKKKNRNKTVRCYSLKNGRVISNDYVNNNADIVITAWKKKGGKVIDNTEL